MISLKYLLDTERLLLTPALDEYIFTKDTRMLYYGDGATPGGKSVVEDELIRLLTNINSKNSDIVFEYNADSQQVTIKAPKVVSEITDLISVIKKSQCSPLNKETIYAETINLTNIISDQPSLEPSYSNNAVNLGSKTLPNTLWINSNKNFSVFTGITDGIHSSNQVSRMSRGTLTSKTTVEPGDNLLFFDAQGWNSSQFIPGGAFGLAVDPNATKPLAPNSMPTMFCAATTTESGDPNFLTFNSKGILSAPIIKATGYTTNNEPLSPEEGWIIFDNTTKQFKGWNGTAWIVLG